MSTTNCNPVILVILDGWGHSTDHRYNSIINASTPTWDEIWNTYPTTLISASGIDVGLPDKQMGNSEVGHMNIGSGRVIEQDFTRIMNAIDSGAFFENEALCQSMQKIRSRNGALHIMGLLSPGGVHSHQEHIFALIKLATDSGIERIYLHGFLDGRDTPPGSAKAYIEETMDNLGTARFASIIGRFYAMDRNQNWDRTESAYNLITRGKPVLAQAMLWKLCKWPMSAGKVMNLSKRLPSGMNQEKQSFFRKMTGLFLQIIVLIVRDNYLWPLRRQTSTALNE